MAQRKQTEGATELKRLYTPVCALYALMHGGLLAIPSGIFWDDWVLYRADPKTLFEIFEHAGSLFNLVAYLHVLLLEAGPWLYKTCTFFLMLGAGYFCFFILRRNELFDRDYVTVTTLLFVLLPFNMARAALICLPSTIFYFLFFLSWWAMFRWPYLSAIGFLISFNTQSLLVFFALPLLELFYCKTNSRSVRSIIAFGRQNALWISMPISFFLFKTIFFPPHGLYEGYNSNYRGNNLLSASRAQFSDIANFSINGALFILLLPASYILTSKLLPPEAWSRRLDRGSMRLPMLLGATALGLALLPYWILDHVPTFIEWTSRHQLLMPLGVALCLSGGVFLSRGWMRRAVLSVIVAVCLAFGVNAYSELYADWRKQQALINFFESNASVRASELIVIDDCTGADYALRRFVRFYEWNGMLEAAFGDQSRFAITAGQEQAYLNGSLDIFITPHLKAAAHSRASVSRIARVKIERSGWSSRWMPRALNIASKLVINVEEETFPRFVEQFARRAGR